MKGLRKTKRNESFEAKKQERERLLREKHFLQFLNTDVTATLCILGEHGEVKETMW